jgi:hypothetical protein
MYGSRRMSFWISVANRFRVCVDNSSSFISLFVKFLNPALVGCVKKGLKVLMEDGFGVLVNMPFTMFVAMPGWTSMSKLGCQQVKRQVAVDPLFVCVMWRTQLVGRDGTSSSSLQQTFKIPWQKVGSIFSHCLLLLSLVDEGVCGDVCLFGEVFGV